MITPSFLQATAYLLCSSLGSLSLTHPILSNRCIPVHTNAAAFITHFRYLNALETHVIRIYIIVLISIAQVKEYDDVQRKKELSYVHYFKIKVFGNAIIYVLRN